MTGGGTADSAMNTGYSARIESMPAVPAHLKHRMQDALGRHVERRRQAARRLEPVHRPLSMGILRPHPRCTLQPGEANSCTRQIASYPEGILLCPGAKSGVLSFYIEQSPACKLFGIEPHPNPVVAALTWLKSGTPPL